MNKSLLLLLVTLLSGCSSTIKRPYFFEATRNQDKVYVLGTLHLGVPAKDLPDPIHNRLRESNSVAFESTDSTLPEIDRNIRNLESAIQKSETPLRKYISEADFKRYLKVTAPLAKANPHRESYSPLLAFVLAGQSEVVVHRADAQKMKFLSRARMDEELQLEAKTAKRVLISLDEKHLLSSECGDRLFADLLLGTLEVVESGEDTQTSDALVEAVETYRQGAPFEERDLKRIQKAFTLPDCLLADRNERWAGMIDRNATAWAPLFVAVGAAHLYGEKNLLSLLESKGFKVQRWQP